MADTDDFAQNVLDFSGQGLKTVEIVPGADPSTVIYDQNTILKIEHLEKYHRLHQVSFASNRLVHMHGVAKLYNLTVLNLPNNSIVGIEGLRNLTQLTWLSLSGNSIKTIDHLNTNVNLKHLDLSDNSIATLHDVSFLKNLEVFLLHGNIITSLKTVSTYLPKSLQILSLAENEISDLNEVSYLCCLPNVEQLSIMNNPCVLMTAQTPGYDYRPFVINWCMKLRILDGFQTTDKECLKAEWLYCQGRGRHFKPGQHVQLIQYLAQTCPLTEMAGFETEEDSKLKKVLSKQRLHQRQLFAEKSVIGQDLQTFQTPQPARSKSPGPKKVSPKSDLAKNRDDTASPQLYPMETPASLYSDVYDRSPVQAWHSTSESFASGLPPAQISHPGDLIVQDIDPADEANLNSSLLESDSRFVSLTSTNPFGLSAERPVTAPPGTTSFAEIFAEKENMRPKTAENPKENKYSAHENKPIKTVNEELKKTRLAAKFSVSPQLSKQSENNDETNRKRAAPVTPRLEMADSDQENYSSDGGIRESKLSLVKKTAAARMLKKAVRKIEVVQPTSPKKFATSKSPPTSPYKNEYKPQKYSPKQSREPKFRNKQRSVKENVKKTVENSQGVDSILKAVRELSFSSRTHEQKSSQGLKDKRRAATVLQATWRGYYARTYSPDVVSVREEIKRQRTDEHIRQLKVEVERQRSLYEQEKQLRLLQSEAMKLLWKEMKQLQEWKQEVISSGIVTSKSQYGSGSSGHMESKMTELQKQVYQLQQVVQGLFKGSHRRGRLSDSTDSEEADTSTIHLRTFFGEDGGVSKKILDNTWGLVQKQHASSYYSKCPKPGTPTPPTDLQFQEITSMHGVLLKWQLSCVLEAHGKPGKEPVIGYRVYINSLARGMIPGSTSTAMVEGLVSGVVYRILVRAVSTAGESYDSDILTIQLSESPSEKAKLPQHDSDKDYDSTDEKENISTSNKYTTTESNTSQGGGDNEGQSGGGSTDVNKLCDKPGCETLNDGFANSSQSALIHTVPLGSPGDSIKNTNNNYTSVVHRNGLDVTSSGKDSDILENQTETDNASNADRENVVNKSLTSVSGSHAKPGAKNVLEKPFKLMPNFTGDIQQTSVINQPLSFYLSPQNHGNRLMPELHGDTVSTPFTSTSSERFTVRDGINSDSVSPHNTNTSDSEASYPSPTKSPKSPNKNSLDGTCLIQSVGDNQNAEPDIAIISLLNKINVTERRGKEHSLSMNNNEAVMLEEEEKIDQPQFVATYPGAGEMYTERQIPEKSKPDKIFDLQHRSQSVDSLKLLSLSQSDQSNQIYSDTAPGSSKSMEQIHSNSRESLTVSSKQLLRNPSTEKLVERQGTEEEEEMMEQLGGAAANLLTKLHKQISQ